MDDKKYMDSLENTPDPDMISFQHLQIDYKRLIDYAKSKGVLPCDLSEEEKNAFVIK